MPDKDGYMNDEELRKHHSVEFDEVLTKIQENKYPTPQELNLRYPEWRPQQRQAMTWFSEDRWLDPDVIQAERDAQKFKTFENFLDNQKLYKIKIAEAPTGAGKTGIILGLAAQNPDLRFLVLCATKLEQNQFEDNMTEESDARSLKGRGNYHCKLEHPETQHTNEECSKDNCDLVHVDMAPCQAGESCEFAKFYKNEEGAVTYGDGSCFYYSKLTGIGSIQTVIANYAYGLSMLNYAPNALGKFDVIVCDECHILDAQLESFIKLVITKSTYDRLYGDVINVALPEFFKGGTIPQWKQWVRENIVAIREQFNYYDSIKESDARSRSQFIQAQNYLQMFNSILTTEDDWVIEEGKFNFEFQPVWVTNDSERVLFNHAKRIILMSGTIPSSLELGKKLGIAPPFDFVRLPYTFPVENRPIIVRPKVNLVFKKRKANMPILVTVFDALIDEYWHDDLKVLVHSHTYDIANYLKDRSDWNSKMLTHTSRNRIPVLNQFKEATTGTILVSPSMDKAVDLPGEQCELTVICKLPWGYLGTKVMQARVKQSQTYYNHETLMGIIQMAGRGVRSNTDVCPTVILDAGTPKFLATVKTMMPKAISDAIQIEHGEEEGDMRYDF